MAPTVLVVTGSEMPVPDPEVGSVAAGLRALGAESSVVTWDDASVEWAAADLVLIRSPWDYTFRLEPFLAWARAVAAVTLLANPLPVIEWNAHKGYLVELADAGVPVVPTALVRSGEPAGDTFARLAASGEHGYVVKPAVSAGAMDTTRHDTRAAALDALQALSSGRDAVLQPFLPGISAGERSLVFVDGTLSHSVVKVPAAGDYRIHEHYGGSTTVWSATVREIEVARAALSAAPTPGPLLYARVDLVGPPDVPIVIELELIEPDLFLGHVPGALQRFAAAALSHAVPR